MDVGQGDPLVMETPRLLERRPGLTEQDGIARKAKDKIRPAVGGDHIDNLRGGKMTSAAAQSVGVRPVAPERRQQPDQDQGIVGSRRAGARTQGGRDQGMRRPFENEKRQIVMVLVVIIIERALLLAIRRIIRVVQLQDKGGGGCSVAGDAVGHQGACESLEILAVDVVLETREGRGTGSVVGRLQGTPLHAEFEHGVMAEVMGVMCIRIS